VYPEIDYLIACVTLWYCLYCRPLTYNQDSELPVYKWTTSNTHFPLEGLARVLLTDDVPKEKVCMKQPVRVHHNASFVVDVHSLDHPQDIRADENGVWMRKGSPVAFVSIHTKDNKMKIFRQSSMGNHPNHFKISRVYYRHASSPDFQSIITTAYGMYIMFQCAH